MGIDRTSRNPGQDGPLSVILAHFQPATEQAPAVVNEAATAPSPAGLIHDTTTVFHLRARGESAPPPAPEEIKTEPTGSVAQVQVLWNVAAAEASAVHWSARLREQLAQPWLTLAQRRVLEGRLAIIQVWLRGREPLLLDQENMRRWIEGTFARWELERTSV
jgi:hypothetical protein